MRRENAFRALTLGAAVLVGCVLAEICLRVAALAPLPLNYASGRGRLPFPDSPNGCFHFATTALSYRTGEIPFEKPAGEYRVVVVGDSHTNGTGVDDADRFSNVIERALAADPSHASVRVMNFGRPGTTIPDYLADLRTALPWHPDEALCVIYSGNDVAGMIPYLDGGKPSGPGAPTLADRVLALPRRMYLYHLLAFSRNAIALSFRGGRATLPLNTREPFTQALGQTDYFKRHTGVRDRALASVRGYLKDLRAQCERSGVRLAIAVLPTKLQVEPELAADVGQPIAREIGLDWNDGIGRDLETYRDVLRLAREVDPDASDLLDALRRSPTRDEKFWHQDWHLSIAGHRAVGSALLARVDRGAPAAPKGETP